VPTSQTSERCDTLAGAPACFHLYCSDPKSPAVVNRRASCTYYIVGFTMIAAGGILCQPAVLDGIRNSLRVLAKRPLVPDQHRRISGYD